MVYPAPKRARRKLETDTDNDNGSYDAGDTRHAYDWATTHNRGGRQGNYTASTSQLLSESIIELLHVCTLIQVELNSNTDGSDRPDEYEGVKEEEG
eukprot:g13753.t1